MCTLTFTYFFYIKHTHTLKLLPEAKILVFSVEDSNPSTWLQPFNMAEPRKVIYGVHIHDEKCKKKAMKAISSVKGIESINFDMNSKKLTVVGIFDPICGFDRLDKVCETELLVVEIVKQEEKKEEPKKEEPKKEEAKKEEEKKDPNETYKVWSYEPNYNPRMPQGGYYVIMEENPNPNCCVIS